MSKHRKSKPIRYHPAAVPDPAPGSKNRRQGLGAILIVVSAAAAVIATGVMLSKDRAKPSTSGLPAPTNTALTPVLSNSLASTSAPPAPVPIDTNAPVTMEVNKALMVTVELDFGAKIPSIAEALREVERRYRPDDGKGRTFAILDAYGETTPQGKLHISMHVSMEKPGQAELVFRRTGETLWQSRIVAGTNAAPFTGKNLLIYLDDGAGKAGTVDGSQNPATILDATIKEGGVPISVFWPVEAEREVTFLYSACGCPVKVMAKRTPTGVVRTRDVPVIFPDDPEALAVINRLMGW